MKSIFSRSLSLQLRVFIAVIIAIVTIITDSNLNKLVKIRTYIDTIISPLYFLTNCPRQIIDNLSQILITRAQLVLENQALRQELLLKNIDQMLLGRYKQENTRLRELLNSPLRHDEHKMVTQVIFTNTDLSNYHVVIDKGLVDGVYVGQPVINDKGLIGQVVAANKLTSRVMLICDVAHALPIQVLRNDIRFIVTGNGCYKDLKLELDYLPGNTDIRVGDILVTSGLGGRFPEGYPVAIVSYVKFDNNHAYTIIKARPTAVLHSLHYLLLWSSDQRSEVPLPPDEVHRIANKRIMMQRIVPEVLSFLSKKMFPTIYNVTIFSKNSADNDNKKYNYYDSTIASLKLAT